MTTFRILLSMLGSRVERCPFTAIAQRTFEALGRAICGSGPARVLVRRREMTRWQASYGDIDTRLFIAHMAAKAVPYAG